MLVGEVGHHTLLYEMSRWQVRAAIRGQQRKNRSLWECARLISFANTKVMGGAKDCHSLFDFMSFSWDVKTEHEMTDEEIDATLDLIREENERLEQERKEKEQP